MNKILDKIKSSYKASTQIITPTAVLAIICVVVTLALSSTNLLTYKKIEALAIETQNKAMSKLIEADEYTQQTAMIDDEKITYNAAVKDGDTVGVIFVSQANGYGGVVSVMTAIDMNGNIISVEILAASDETPGLGQNVTKESFYSQYAGLKDNVTVVKGGAANKENNEINAVTGATISSKAVTTAVNQALDYAAQIIVKEDIAVEN